MTRNEKRAQRARRHSMLRTAERMKPTQNLAEGKRRKRFGDQDIPYSVLKGQV